MKQLFTIFLLAFSGTAFSQGFEFRQKTDVKVVIGTDTLKNAWAGGLNSPVFSKIKLDTDATEDLYVFDREQNKSFTFLARQINGAWTWIYAPEYEAFFPTNLRYFVLLRDYDGDGDKDLFSSNPLGLTVYKNTPVNGRPAFGPQRSLKYRLSTTGSATDFELGDFVLPSLTDMDGDGDLDVLTFDVSESYRRVYYYKNYSKEFYSINDSLHFVRDNPNNPDWGSIYRCISPNCTNFNFGPAINCRTSAVQHGEGASLLALDLDNDGDKDLLTGGDFCNNLTRLQNNIGPGIPGGSSMNAGSVTASYPTGTTPVNLINFPAPYLEDVTFDQKPDLLVAPFLPNIADFPDYRQSSWLYRNTAASATAAPVFTFQQKNFLQSEMIDQSYGALPLFLDVDGDSDLDMLVSNNADYRNGAFSSSVVYLYTNVGTVAKPVFKLTNPDYLSFSQANSGAGYREIILQLGDMDNDGKKDLILKFSIFSITGSASPYTAFLPNQATGSQLYSFTRTNMVQLGIDTENNNSSYFYDMDGDGDLDLLRGTNEKQISPGNGPLLFYRRNAGISPDLYAAWVLENNNVGNMQPSFSLNENPHPLIADLDGDNIPELLTAGQDGNIRIFRNFLGNLSGTLTPETSIVLNPLTNTKTGTRLGKLSNSSSAGLHMTAADLDGDQKPELIVGTAGGGLVYYKNYSMALGLKGDLAAAAINLNVYPNPANDLLKLTAAEKVQVTVFDASGREVLSKTPELKTEHELHTGNLKPGVYFLKIEAAGYRSAGRTFIIQR
jgi:hypothetical protein